MPGPFDQWHFDTKRIGRRVMVADEVESTNAVATNLPGTPEHLDGLIVVAKNQTAGRGRFGRIWRSRPGSSLLASIILFPPTEVARPSALTALAAVAVAETIFELAGVDARIKWPNDLLVSGRKVCGILIEQRGEQRANGAACFRTVVGIGLNLNQTVDEFASAGLPEATSLAIACGCNFTLRTAVAALASHLDAVYDRLLAGDRVTVEAEWKRRTGLLGRTVEVELSDGARVVGRMREMTFDGVDIELATGILRHLVPETIEQIREGK